MNTCDSVLAQAGLAKVGDVDQPDNDRRKQRRLPLKYKVAVVYHEHKGGAVKPTYHGVTNDISLLGVSVVVDNNIFNAGFVKLLIAIPPECVGDPQKIIEATAQMRYTVLSSEHDAFRVGLSFVSFKRNGRELLAKTLAMRSFSYGVPSLVD